MIAYDTNILIYALEGSSPWSTAAQEIVTRGEREGAVLSILARQELITGVVLKNPDLDETIYRVLSDLEADFIPVTEAIVERAISLTRQYGKQVYGYDAIHIATAIEAGAEAFITNDKKLTQLFLKELPIRSL